MSPFALRHQLSSTIFALLVVLGITGISGCDDKPKGDQKSVLEGGKAESAPGKQLENAKQKVDDAEKQLNDRADQQFESAQDEKVGRGVP